MKKAFLKVAALFVLLACYVNIVCAQSDSQMLENIYEIYSKYHFSDNQIMNINGKWYFVTVVNPKHEQRRDARQASYEKNFGFFIKNKIKNYPKFTRLPKDMTNASDIEEVYNTLIENKKEFYDMPQIGVKKEIGSEVYFFAKEITTDGQDMTKTNSTNNSSTTTTDTPLAPQSNSSANADSPQKSQTVTLVVYGTADNEETAIKTALRSAIEQAFGTFVSSNTTIVNDELTRDEIVSVASGNIEKYSLISSTKEPDGKSSVSVKATVSIGKLLQFAQSKGATTELSGAAFAMNMKMRKLNKENEYQAICHMLDKMIKISELNLFDYSIRIDDPKKTYDGLYGLPTIIFVTPNENYNNLVSIFQTTIKALSMSDTEQKDYTKTNDRYYKYDNKYYLLRGTGFTNSKGWLINNFPFVLRNNIEDFRSKFEQLKINIWKSSMSFKILDNIGNKSTPIHVIVRDKYTCKNSGCDWPIYIYAENDTYNLYGITSSADSYNRSFLGGASCNNEAGFPTIFKSLYYKEDRKIINDISWPVTYNLPLQNYIWRRNLKMDVHHDVNLLFCADSYEEGYYGDFYEERYEKGWFYRGKQSCLDLSGKTYPYFIYLYYNENDISKVSSITIEPSNPTEIKNKTFKVEN